MTISASRPRTRTTLRSGSVYSHRQRSGRLNETRPDSRAALVPARLSEVSTKRASKSLYDWRRRSTCSNRACAASSAPRAAAGAGRAPGFGSFGGPAVALGTPRTASSSAALLTAMGIVFIAVDSSPSRAASPTCAGPGIGFERGDAFEGFEERDALRGAPDWH